MKRCAKKINIDAPRGWRYTVIALTPSTPAIVVSTAIATFKTILQTDFLIAIIKTPPFHQLSFFNS